MARGFAGLLLLLLAPRLADAQTPRRLQTAASDKAALLDMKALADTSNCHSWNGGDGPCPLDSWEPATEPCGVGWDDFLKGWVGVICVEEGGAVVSVALPDTGIGGLILPALGRLLELRYLNLDQNPVRGSVAALSDLVELRSIVLRGSAVFGGMPALPNLGGNYQLPGRRSEAFTGLVWL